MSNFTSSSTSDSGYASTFEGIASAITDATDTSADDDLLAVLESTSSNVTIADFYQIYLWNYCAGNVTTDLEYEIGECSTPKAFYWFNPISTWGLNDTAAEDLFGDKLTTLINTYHTVAKVMFVAYAVAFFCTLATFIFGIWALFSRMGSLITSCCAAVSTPASINRTNVTDCKLGCDILPHCIWSNGYRPLRPPLIHFQLRSRRLQH